MKAIIESVNSLAEGERWRAVVRFWKATLMALAASLLVPIASGADWHQVLQAWPQELSMAILTGLGMGGEKLVRTVWNGE